MKSIEIVEDARMDAPSEESNGRTRPESTFRDAILGAGASLPGMIALSGQTRISTDRSGGGAFPEVVVAHVDGHTDVSRSDGTHSNAHTNNT